MLHLGKHPFLSLSPTVIPALLMVPVKQEGLTEAHGGRHNAAICGKRQGVLAGSTLPEFPCNGKVFASSTCTIRLTERECIGRKPAVTEDFTEVGFQGFQDGEDKVCSHIMLGNLAISGSLLRILSKQ